MADLALKNKQEIAELIKRVAKELYTDKDWSGLRTGTFEWLLSQIVAEISVLNGQYLDLRADNAYLSTATLRTDIRAIAANLGLIPGERSGATVNINMTASADVTIPKGTRLVSSSGEVFATLHELTLSTATALSNSVEAVHAEFEQVSHRARGDAGELIQLNRDDVLINNLTVSVEGQEWEKVDNLFGQTSTSRVYRAVFDERNRVAIKFGNGVYGARLPADAQVLIDMYKGGGPGGNAVAANTITTLLDSFSNSGNITSINNASAATGGKGQDSLEEISEQIPGQLRQISGLINPEDIARVIKANLNFIADANAQRGHNLVNGVFVPKVTISAYPHAESITDLSASQSSQLSEFLSNRGQLGVTFAAQDAYESPVEVEVEVSLQNRNLQTQKEAEIKAALVSNDDAPFSFSNLGFNKQYTIQSILNTVESVPGVLYAKVNRFARIPHALSVQGFETAVNGFADIELGEEAEDGYFHFRATDSGQSSNVSFMRPFKTTKVGNNFIQSAEVNWLVEQHDYSSGGKLNDTGGPYVKVNGSNKLEFKQLNRVWKNDQFNGSTYNHKYILRVQYVDLIDNTKEAYYTISDTIRPGTLSTVEDADTPVSGDPILSSLATTDNTNISIQIIRDQTPYSTLMTPQGVQFDITHNNKNTLYLDSDPSGQVPINEYSYIHFNEAELDTTNDNWISYTGSLRARLHTNSEPFSYGDLVEIYTTPVKADRLHFKHPREVFTLSLNNITIRFI